MALELSTQDYLKKALLDTQERVRDFMGYAEQTENPQLKQNFKSFAKTEAKQAQQLENFIKSIQ
jgi:rubrerythrin